MSDKTESLPPPPIGTRIRRLREERGLTLAALAVRVGTSVPTMHRYEGGWDRFELETLRRIANALGADLEVRFVPSHGQVWDRPPEKKELLELLDPLFWDHDLNETSLDRHGSWVLGRVLMFGNQAQASAARAFFGDDKVRRAMGRREIDLRTRNYWTLMLEEEPCIPRS